MLPSSLPPPTTTMQENIKKGEVMWPKLAANKILRWPLGSTNFVADSLPPPTTTMQENIKKGEVMWPKLVANKILRRPLGRTNFVADIPNSEIRLEETSSDNLVTAQKNHDNKMETHTYKLFATTWNIAGNSPSDDLNLEDWLDTRNNSYDIYVLGFQEIVPLSAKNVLGPEQRKISMQWNSLISSTLNESVCNLEGEPKEGGEKQNVYTVKDINTSRQLGYQCIISKQMVGIYISVWVRGSLLRFVRQPSVSCVGCGIMGCLGNKGSVSVRFFFHETSFCFVCCHLASGAKEGDEINRNADATEIFSRTSFPRGPFRNPPQKILEHDRIILLGDLNYRISLPESETRSLVEQKEWNILLEKDQLRGEVYEGGAFEGWLEGDIEFTPTYKYYPNSDHYYGCLQSKKGEKKRAPAWCDRILWRGNGLKQVRYDRYELKFSDHRPVRAAYEVEVEGLKMNSLRSFFLSDRFDCLSSRSNLLSINEDNLSRSNRLSMREYFH